MSPVYDGLISSLKAKVVSHPTSIDIFDRPLSVHFPVGRLEDLELYALIAPLSISLLSVVFWYCTTTMEQCPSYPFGS